MISEDNKTTASVIVVVACACAIVGAIAGALAGATAGVGVGLMCWLGVMGIMINTASTAQKTYHEDFTNIRIVGRR